MNNPADLDADLLGETLSEFFTTGGWGTVTMSPVGTGALALDSSDWAEADPGTAQTPMCFFSAGMLADFLGRLSDETIAVMEVECRSRGDERCRLLSAAPGVPKAPDAFEQIVGVPRDRRVFHATGHFAALHAVGESHRMAEGAADHVPLPYADQVIDDQAIVDVADQATAQHLYVHTGTAIPAAKQDVRIPDVGFAEDATPP